MTDQLPPPVLIADSPAIDFLNSVAVPVDTKVEWLRSGEDLITWLLQAGMLPTDIPPIVRKASAPGELDAVAGQARALREWFRKFVDAHKGRPLKPKALQELGPLNRILARDEEFGQVVAREKIRRVRPASAEDSGPESVSGLVWSPQRRWRSPDSLLLPIARAMAELICENDFTHVKACEGHNCVLMFVDRTRGRARRWCSMAVCGNRAKQAAHRERAHLARK
jgi:predicted RNA-binding Zn ribbon-like protein